jgi:hypothetical protein
MKKALSMIIIFILPMCPGRTQEIKIQIRPRTNCLYGWDVLGLSKHAFGKEAFFF